MSHLDLSQLNTEYDGVRYSRKVQQGMYAQCSKIRKVTLFGKVLFILDIKYGNGKVKTI